MLDSIWRGDSVTESDKQVFPTCHCSEAPTAHEIFFFCGFCHFESGCHTHLWGKSHVTDKLSANSPWNSAEIEGLNLHCYLLNSSCKKKSGIVSICPLFWTRPPSPQECERIPFCIFLGSASLRFVLLTRLTFHFNSIHVLLLLGNFLSELSPWGVVWLLSSVLVFPTEHYAGNRFH